MRARSHSTGSSRLKWRRNRSKLQSPWWWDSSAPRMSNGVASAGTSSGSATKTNSASGSRNRRISQAHAARSMWQPARVAHLIASAPPEGGDLPLGCARTGSGWAWTLAWSCLQSPHNHLLMQPWLPRRLLDRVSWLVEFVPPPALAARSRARQAVAHMRPNATNRASRRLRVGWTGGRGWTLATWALGVTCPSSSRPPVLRPSNPRWRLATTPARAAEAKARDGNRGCSVRSLEAILAGMGMDARQQWVFLAYRLPREPSTPRIAVWRKLRRLGVVQLLDGLVVLPLDNRTREQLEWLADEPTTRRRLLGRLRRELHRIAARDYFPAAERDLADQAVERLAATLERERATR